MHGLTRSSFYQLVHLVSLCISVAESSASEAAHLKRLYAAAHHGAEQVIFQPSPCSAHPADYHSAAAWHMLGQGASCPSWPPVQLFSLVRWFVTSWLVLPWAGLAMRLKGLFSS